MRINSITKTFSLMALAFVVLLPTHVNAAIAIERAPSGSDLYDEVVYTVTLDDTFDVECGDDPQPSLTDFSLMVDGGDGNVYRANQFYTEESGSGTYDFTFNATDYGITGILEPVNVQLFRVSIGWGSLTNANSGNANSGMWEICLNGYDLETGGPMFQWGFEETPPPPEVVGTTTAEVLTEIHKTIFVFASSFLWLLTAGIIALSVVAFNRKKA